MSFPKASDADIALLLEGTFPYVSGGVSSWVNQMIRAYPDYRFAIVFLGSRRDDYTTFKYELPANVVHFEEHFLYDDITSTERPPPRQGNEEAFRLASQLHEKFAPGCPRHEALDAFKEVAHAMLPGGKLNLDDFLHSEGSWEIICDRTTGASAPTPPSSTTSGPCASCTRRSGCWPALPKTSFRCARCMPYRPAMPASSAPCCTRPAAHR
jgi:hypothetical protein